MVTSGFSLGPPPVPLGHGDLPPSLRGATPPWLRFGPAGDRAAPVFTGLVFYQLGQTTQVL